MLSVSLTSRGIYVHFEPPVGSDSTVNMVIVQILDVVTGGVVKAQLLQGHRNLKTESLNSVLLAC